MEGLSGVLGVQITSSTPFQLAGKHLGKIDFFSTSWVGVHKFRMWPLDMLRSLHNHFFSFYEISWPIVAKRNAICLCLVSEGMILLGPIIETFAILSDTIKDQRLLESLSWLSKD